jgi:hypothetical protein
MQNLLKAMNRDKVACKDVFDTVMEECSQMEEEISKVPPGILKLLSPRLADEFAKLVLSHDCNFRLIHHGSLGLRSHYSVCKAMFRSVLTRFIEKFDMSSGETKILSVIMLENLDSVPALLKLRLNPWESHQTVQLEGMKHLKNLKIFTFPSKCTDEIIEQLQLHCPHLTVVDIANSKQVTNASVQYLRKVRKLRFLHLCGTNIDEHYGLLLSESPNIGNITFERSVGSLLRHIAVERLDTITRVRIVPPAIYRNVRDVSGLTVFNALRALEFRFLNYDSSNIKTVLQGLGHRLSGLTLDSCYEVDLQDITILCPCLVNLTLTGCSLFNLNSGIPFDFQLPHFRNLINLEISYILRNPDINYIRYYSSLKSIRLSYTGSFTVDLVNEILNLGTYKQLEKLHISEFSSDVEALKLLIGHCPLLKRIEFLLFAHLQSDVLEELKRQVLSQNFDLKIIDMTMFLSLKYMVA